MIRLNLLVILLFLTSCTTVIQKTGNTFAITNAIINLDRDYNQAEKIILDSCDILGSIKCSEIKHNLKNIKILKAKLEFIVSNRSLAEFSELNFIYASAEQSYLSIKTSISDLDLNDQQLSLLKYYDDNVNRLSKNINQLLTINDKDHTNTLVSIVNLLSQILNVAGAI